MRISGGTVRRKIRRKYRQHFVETQLAASFPPRCRMLPAETLQATSLRKELTLAEKLTDAQPHLHRVDPRIRRGQSRIGDVHVPQLQAYIVLRAQDMYTKCGLVHEVYRVRSRGYVVVREDDATSQFQVRRKPTMPLEIPLQAKRIKPNPIRRSRGLEDQEDGDSVDRIFETAAKNTGQVFTG